VTFKPKFRQGKDKKCWCGSKKKEKNCHGARSAINQSVSATTAPPQLTTDLPLGISGEEQKLWVVPVFQGEDPTKKAPNLNGTPGRYKVQLLLSRPGYPLWPEREYKFIDEIIGDSHLLIAKPLAQRGVQDAHHVLLHAINGKGNIKFKGIPNESGYLGKFSVDELTADSFIQAEALCYECLCPFLSAWSLHLDLPVNIHTIQVTELSTHITSVRAKTPHFDMTFGGGISPMLTDDFCHHASVYREGMNTNSPFYRFLCFFKIIESIAARRSRRNAERAAKGQQVVRFQEVIPSTDEDAISLLRRVFTCRSDFAKASLKELFPEAARGKKLSHIIDKFNKIRVGIAHAVLQSGEIRISIDQLEHIQEVNLWLPLCRIIARWMLSIEFSREYEFKMNSGVPPEILAAFG